MVDSKDLQAVEKLKEKERSAHYVLLAILAGVLAACLITIVSIFALHSKGKTENTTGDLPMVPAVVSKDLGIIVNAEGKAVTEMPLPDKSSVHVFFDPQCPACKIFDEHYMPELLSRVKDSNANLVVHPVSFLDRASRDRFSSRAASSVYTVAQEQPEKTLEWINTLYDNQPKEGGVDSLSNDEMGVLGKTVGLTDEVVNKINENFYQDWIVNATQTFVASSNKFFPNPQEFGTPSIFVSTPDGKVEPVVAGQDFLKDLDEKLK